MINTYFTDRVTVISRTFDAARRSVETETQYDARVERSDVSLRNDDGEDIQAGYIIFMDPAAAIRTQDHLRIEEIDGTTTGDTRQFPVLRVFKANGFESHHLEVNV